jgi:hopanoid biosynthesis associated RND transporter like protein HpnN
VNRSFRTASPERNAQNEALIKALPALEKIIAQASDSLQRAGLPPSPGIEALFGGGEQAEGQMYITFAKGQIYLVTAQAAAGALSNDAVNRLRELVQQTQLEVPGLNVGITGEPVLEFDEMAQSQRDTTLATIVCLVLVGLIFVYGYHETGRPMKATACLLVGLSYTMAFTAWAVGHLNVLTVTFVPILIGLAIDFGVHLISRYEEELRNGKTPKEALDKAMVFTGQGILTGAFTTAGAFLAMVGTNFKGIQEMGIICGFGLLICLVPMITLLPILILRGRQNVTDVRLGKEPDRRERIEKLWLARPRTAIAITLTLCLLAAIPARKVGFDYNLLNMQSAGLPAVIFQDKLIRSSSKSVLFGAIMVRSLDEAITLRKRVLVLPAVESVDLGGIDSLTENLTEDQTRKLALVGEIKRAVLQIHFPQADIAPINFADLNQALFSLHGYVTLATSAVKTEDPALCQRLLAMRETITRFRTRLLSGDRSLVLHKLGAFQQALFTDVRETFQAIQTQDDRSPLRVDDLPPALKSRVVGLTGNYLLQVYPRKDVWERKAQEEFVHQLRQVFAGVTGTPVQLLEYTTLLKNSYEQAAAYSLVAIALLVLIHFRNFACVLFALLPVAVGSLWMLGVMGFCHVQFNPANIMTLPLVIGIGVTNGVHILNRFAEEKHPSLLAKSTGKAVLVSGLTTIAGFGSLMLAKHRGIESLGFVMSVGVATCMIAGLTFLPAILNLLARRGWTIRKPSGDNARSTTGSGGTEVQNLNCTATITNPR